MCMTNGTRAPANEQQTKTNKEIPWQHPGRVRPQAGLTATKRAGGGGAGKKEKAREEDKKGGGAPAAPREERDRTDKGSETPRHDPG